MGRCGARPRRKVRRCCKRRKKALEDIGAANLGGTKAWLLRCERSLQVRFEQSRCELAREAGRFQRALWSIEHLRCKYIHEFVKECESMEWLPATRLLTFSGRQEVEKMDDHADQGLRQVMRSVAAGCCKGDVLSISHCRQAWLSEDRQRALVEWKTWLKQFS